MHINADYIRALLKTAESSTDQQIEAIIAKAETLQGLSHTDVAALLTTENPAHLKKIFAVAHKIKEQIYGDRIVMFAPLYVSDYCVNQCSYCGYQCANKFERRRLTMDEIRQEARSLEQMGHKRLALEAGEDPENCPIDYILECIKTLYDEKLNHGEIRRVNVNIAATTIENYQKLKNTGIGTYILFQETYDENAYKQYHKSGPKKDYTYHLTAFDRAMQGGIDDVGGGVLFGLADPYFEVLALMMHNEHLDKTYGAGFHTISVPRLCQAEGMDMSEYQHIPTDDLFKKIVAIIRIAVPYTGMIISTRENAQMRKALIETGISQMSGGSQTDVGGYAENADKVVQFKLSDDRSAEDIMTWLMDQDLIPSFCTACYRSGRTGDRFMQLAKSGNIKNVCLPNALMTLCEYMVDYGDDYFQTQAQKLIGRKVEGIVNEDMRARTKENLAAIKNGAHDLFV